MRGWPHRSGAAAFALYILLTAATAWFMPDPNWDMLPYLAIAEEGTYPDAQALHDYAYSTVKAGVAAGDYQTLTDDGGGFRSHMTQNAADFHSLLGMYRIKFLYAEILSTMSSVMSPVEAMRVVSVFSVLLFGAIAPALAAVGRCAGAGASGRRGADHGRFRRGGAR